MLRSIARCWIASLLFAIAPGIGPQIATAQAAYLLPPETGVVEPPPPLNNLPVDNGERVPPFSPPERPAPSKNDRSKLEEGIPVVVSLLDFTIPPGLNSQAPFGSSFIWIPKQGVQNQNAYFASYRQEASVGFPILTEGRDVLIGLGSLRNTQYRTDAFLFSSNRTFPQQLWNLEAGVIWIRDFEDGWKGGGALSISSPSDKPFNSVQEISPSINAFLRVPAEGNDAWQYSLSYSPVGLIRFPVPGIAYEYNPSEELQISLGLPFSVVWKPDETLRFDFGYIPPQSIRSQLTWHFQPEIAIFGGYEWVTDSYLLANRPNRKDIFYSYEQRLPVGVRFSLGKNAVLDLGVGYAFNRLFFTASNFTEQNRDRVHVQPGGFGMVRFALQF